jgi:adenylate cyclase
MKPPRSVLHSLIIDDSDADRFFIERMLRADPEFDITIHNSATMGQGLAAAESDGYDLVIIDHELPDGTGIDGLPDLRRACPRAAVLFVTGHQEMALAAQAVENGAHHFMFKSELSTSALSHGVRVALERHAAASMRAQLKQASVAARTLSRYVPSDLADSVLQPGANGTSMAAHRVEAAILFGDITGSSGMVEGLGADATISFFSSLFSHLSDDVTAYGGIVDKIVGDGLVALFPVRGDDPDAIAGAIRGALEGGAHAIRSFHDEWKTVEGREGVETGFRVGVAYGTVIRGNVGSNERADFTMVGRTVMVAKRLEAMASNNALFYQATIHEHIPVPENARDAGPVALKGLSDLVPAYRIDPMDP